MKDRTLIRLRSNRLNFLFIAFSMAVLAAALIYVSVVIQQKAKDERSRIQTWAISTRRQAGLRQKLHVLYANMEVEERQYAMIWSFVYDKVFDPTPSSIREFEELRMILLRNNRPFILVDADNKIIESHDPNVDVKVYPDFDEALQREYSLYPPIPVDAQGLVYRIYFKPSDVFFSIRDIFSSLERSFIEERRQMTADIGVPVLITDKSRTMVLAWANIDAASLGSSEEVSALLRRMQRKNKPIAMCMPGESDERFFIYYESSSMLRSLRYIAWVLLATLLLEILGMLSLRRFAKRMEQNQVWWSMSKETAHQLGTPVSSLLAWLDYFKIKEDKSFSEEELNEIEKDVKRIELVTNRFSKIGSIPELKMENVVPVVYRSVDYLKGRSSSKITYHIEPEESAVMTAPINASLMEWVMENLCKNALNAIQENTGRIDIRISQTAEHVLIEVEDNGKGMNPNMSNLIFEAGFTTKKRGWGVGLTLCKRIVEEYHGGKIFLKRTAPGQGSLFGILLEKKEKRA